MFDHRQFEHDRTNPTQTHLSTSTNLHDHDDQTVQFRPNNHQFSDDSGVCSPPLWKNSPSSQPLLIHHTQRSLSPNSRAQAILRGQFELMEMVKNMPESSYELSLKDLVENPKTEEKTGEKMIIDENLKQRKQSKRVGEKSAATMMRSESFETKGLFLNVGFSFCWLRSKKKKSLSNLSGKVSPKPHEGLKGGERDWWKKKKFTGSSDSDSSKISSSSGGSSGTTVSSGGSGRSNSGGGRKKNGFLSGGCWPCFKSRSSKSVD